MRLAYRIGLSSYLALPGQPLSMTWEPLADVSTQAVLDARRVIEAREAGHEFLQFAVNDRLWNARLRTEHAAQLEQATATIRGQMDVLEEHPPADLDEYDRQGRALIALRDDAEQQLLMQLTDHYRNARY